MCYPIYVLLRFEFHVVICVMIVPYKTMFGSYLLPVVCRRTHVFVRYLCWCPLSDVQRILCCVFVFLVLCTICCQFPLFLNISSLRFIDMSAYVWGCCTLASIIITMTSRDVWKQVFDTQFYFRFFISHAIIYYDNTQSWIIKYLLLSTFLSTLYHGHEKASVSIHYIIHC